MITHINQVSSSSCVMEEYNQLYTNPHTRVTSSAYEVCGCARYALSCNVSQFQYAHTFTVGTAKVLLYVVVLLLMNSYLLVYNCTVVAVFWPASPSLLLGPV